MLTLHTREAHQPCPLRCRVSSGDALAKYGLDRFGEDLAVACDAQGAVKSCRA